MPKNFNLMITSVPPLITGPNAEAVFLRVSTDEIQRFNELAEIVVDVIESKKC